MTFAKTWKSLILALLSAGVGACRVDAPTAPRLTDQAAPGVVQDLTGTLLEKNALTRRTPLARDITVSATIGRAGGVLAIPAAGFELRIPPGAVSGKTRFTVTAIRGSLVAYEFGPHGLKFPVPLVARQDLAVTTYSAGIGTLSAGYFLNRGDLDDANAKALVAEVISGHTLPLAKRFSWPIDHFSGYIVAW